ncbi:MAG: AAA family ATPase [Candidatus Saccharimonadales bacterium]
MTSLVDHPSNEFVKLLLIGPSKSGKTGSLASLVKAGYKLRILDFDNLLDILKHVIQKECLEMIDNVEFVSLRDRYKHGSGGVVLEGKPKAWDTALRLCDHWKYTDTTGKEIDLGVPAQWGRDCVLVIDSLSRLCDAAYNWHELMIPRGRGGDFDGRAVYRNAQQAVEKFIALLTSDTMAVNVIVTAHVVYQEQSLGIVKGFPQGIGQKLSPKIPTYFSSTVLYTNVGGKRTIQTNCTPLMDLANPRPFDMQPEYSIDTGLAQFFAQLVARPQSKALPKPQPQPQAQEETQEKTPLPLTHPRSLTLRKV